MPTFLLTDQMRMPAGMMHLIISIIYIAESFGDDFQLKAPCSLERAEPFLQDNAVLAIRTLSRSGNTYLLADQSDAYAGWNDAHVK